MKQVGTLFHSVNAFIQRNHMRTMTPRELVLWDALLVELHWSKEEKYRSQKEG